MNQSSHTYEQVMSHVWMSHVTRMNESWHTYEWVMSNAWMSHVTRMNESCHTYSPLPANIMCTCTCHSYDWVMSHIEAAMRHYEDAMSQFEADMSHVSNVLLANITSLFICHTYEWVTSTPTAESHMWKRCATHAHCNTLQRTATLMKESSHTCERVVSHMWRRHVTHTKESCHTKERERSEATHMQEHTCKSHNIHNEEVTSHITEEVTLLQAPFQQYQKRSCITRVETGNK